MGGTRLFCAHATATTRTSSPMRTETARMTAPQPRVFISYQRSDEPFARRVREHLAAHAVDTWMDQYDIPVGAYWPDEIDKGLGSSDIVVGILSPDAVESRNVKNEWDWAIANDKRLLLLQVQPCVIPHRYVSINFIDATQPDLAPALDALLRTLGVAAPTAGPVATVDTTALPAAMRHAGRTRSRPRLAEPLVVGREPEQELLRERLERAMAGAGSVVLLGGEAGIGKTTLASWLAWLAEERGCASLSGGCYDLSTTPPYGPWLELLTGWPDPALLPPVPDDLRGNDAFARFPSEHALYARVQELLEAASDTRPLVLRLEDLHWADPASLALLRYLGRQLGSARVLIVGTYRTDELHRRHPLTPLLPLLAREVGAVRVELGRLSDAAIDELVQQRYHLDPTDRDRLVAVLRQHAGGHALYLGELLRTLEETGVIARRGDGTWALGDIGRVPIPTLVQEVIEGRVARLSAAAQAALTFAAVIGHDVPIELWSRAGEQSEDELLEAVDQAVEAHLLTMTPDGARVQFAHALIREALYESVLPLRRRLWQRRIADALIDTASPDPDAVADHLRAAGDPRAAEWLLRAADRATASFAWRGAAQRLEAALELTDDATERGWLLHRIGRLWRFPDPARALRYLDEAVDVARETGDATLHAYALAALGQAKCFNGDARSGLELLRQGADLIDALPADHVWSRPGLVDWVAGSMVNRSLRDRDSAAPLPAVMNPMRGVHILWEALLGYHSRAIEIGESFVRQAATHERLIGASEDAVGDAWFGLGTAYAMTGRPEQAARAMLAAIANAERRGSYVALAGRTFNYYQNVLLRYHTTDLDQRARYLEIVDTARTAAAEAMTRLRPELIAIIEGHWDAVPEMTRAVETQNAVPFSNVVNSLAIVARYTGEPDVAHRLIRRVLPDGPATAPGGASAYQGLELIHLAIELALDAGDLDAAQAWLDAYERWLDWTGAVVWRPYQALVRSRHARLAGDLEGALALATTALDLASEPRQPLAVLAAQRQLGELLTEAARYAEAGERLREALDLAHACAAPYELALTQIALAELQLATGATDDARDLLDDARATCERLGTRPALQRIAALQGRADASSTTIP
jgi:tetratricopeptide (TPR) repeat protein